MNSLLEELCHKVAVNDSLALSVVAPEIIAEGVAREGDSTRSAYPEFVRLFLRRRAPAGTTSQSLSVEGRLQL